MMNTNQHQEKEDIIVRLQKHYSSLRKSEKKIADYLQQHSQQRLDMSITEFAKLGFQDLKLSLAASLNIAEEFQNIPIEIPTGEEYDVYF